MSRLVRLYPPGWRDRYEAEFLALLEDRPRTAWDIVDTVRGAVDAHLNPQLAATGLEPSPWTHRIPGLLALAAGLMWSAHVVFIAFLVAPGQEWGSLIVYAAVVMLVSLPGDYMAAHGRQIAVVLGAIGACVILSALAPWQIQSLLIIAGYLITIGGMLTLASIRAGIGSGARWRLLVASIALPFACAIPMAIGIQPIGVGAWLILLPYGLAWVLIGLRMAIRGSPTIVDPPLNPIESEVRPA